MTVDLLARCESCGGRVMHALAPCVSADCRRVAAEIHAAFGRLPSADAVATYGELAAIKRREDA